MSDVIIKDVINKMIENGITISTAESITGGYIAKIITDVPGASNILKESYVVYSNESKVKILGVDDNLIKKYGVVSKEVAEEMAKKLYDLTKKDICISTTGNAGPTVCDDKPVGRVYIGICFNGNVNIIECNFENAKNRNEIRVATVYKVFDEIKKILI